MTYQQAQQRHELGMIGLGVMGRNLVLNMADRGFDAKKGSFHTEWGKECGS
ncbi:MAG: NAD(P)-binding domain-containing protein [Methylobacter sp.]|uniref:NAD(P)-binding domain-containing protein n=1 Tax=Methylobacter sp. TaxID=2051955 RepID=UPI0025894919|nr:NAD(P)-binding domain-containing protein [Methylobacter sp.]MCL7421296.1 NAD(P)-binding domain-containing protein [Methylobacter sp.]